MEADADALRRLLSELQRYSGWLAKDHASAAVRADVQALGAAMDTGNDTSLGYCCAPQGHRATAPAGGIRTMLQRALGEIRAEIGPTGVDRERGDRS